MAPGKRSRGDITAPAADAPAQAAQPSGQNQPHVSTTSVPTGRFDWPTKEDLYGLQRLNQISSRFKNKGGSKSMVIFAHLPSIGVIHSVRELQNLKKPTKLDTVYDASVLLPLQGAIQYLTRVLPQTLEEYSMDHNEGPKQMLTPEERSSLTARLNAMLPAELAKQQQEAKASHEAIRKQQLLAAAGPTAAAAGTTAGTAATAYPWTLEDKLQEIEINFGQTTVDAVCVMPVWESGVAFPSLVIRVANEFIFSCPRPLERVVDKGLSIEKIKAAAKRVDLFKSSSNAWYATKITSEWSQLMKILADKDVSEKLHQAYLIRPLYSQHSPAVLACFQSVVLDPGRRAFRYLFQDRFQYVQEVPAPPETKPPTKPEAGTGKQMGQKSSKKSAARPAAAAAAAVASPALSSSASSITAAAAAAAAGPSIGAVQQSDSRKPWQDISEEEKDAKEEGRWGEGIYLDCSRVTCLRERKGVAVATIVDIKERYWVACQPRSTANDKGLKIFPVHLKANINYEIIASLIAEEGMPQEQHWYAAGVALAQTFKDCHQMATYNKLKHESDTLLSPSYFDHAEAVQVLLETDDLRPAGAQLYNRIEDLAWNPEDRVRLTAGVSNLLKDLGLQAGAANAEPMQVDAVTRSPSPSKAALGSKERAQMPVAVTPRDQDITAAAGMIAGDRLEILIVVCEKVAAAALRDASTTDVIGMSRAAAIARSQIQKQQQFSPDLLPPAALRGRLHQVVDKAVEGYMRRVGQQSEIDTNVSGVVLKEVEKLYGVP